MFQRFWSWIAARTGVEALLIREVIKEADSEKAFGDLSEKVVCVSEDVGAVRERVEMLLSRIANAEAVLMHAESIMESRDDAKRTADDLRRIAAAAHEMLSARKVDDSEKLLRGIARQDI